MNFHFHKWSKWIDGGVALSNSMNTRMTQTSVCEKCGARRFRVTNSVGGYSPDADVRAVLMAVEKEKERK